MPQGWIEMRELRQAVMDIKRDEIPLAIFMFSYFFLVITCFWILKPIKKGLFIEFYDQSGFYLLGTAFTAPQAELLAKILNMLVAFAAVVVFSLLSRKFQRQQLSFSGSGWGPADRAARVRRNTDASRCPCQAVIHPQFPDEF